MRPPAACQAKDLLALSVLCVPASGCYCYNSEVGTKEGSLARACSPGALSAYEAVFCGHSYFSCLAT